MIPIVISATILTTPDGCKISMNRSNENGKIYEAMRVENPDVCPDRGFVRYLNCDNTMLPRDKQPKECK